MTEYELKWLSFVEETKNSDTENLNEYISDIINTAKTIADRAKGQGPDSPLSGLGRAATNYKKGEKEKEEEEEETSDTPAAPAAAPYANRPQDRTRLDLIKILIYAKTKAEFAGAYNELLKSKFGKGKNQNAIKDAIDNRDARWISAFGGDDDTRTALMKKFKELFLSGEAKRNPPAAKKPAAKKKAAAKKSKPMDPMSVDEGIGRKDRVIIERWQKISGINKKEI